MSRLGGRRVSMAPHRIRRAKRDANSLAEAEEATGSSGRLKNAIFNEEIARLLIREEDLIRVSRDARASAVSFESATRPTSAATWPSSAPDGDTPAMPTYRRVAVRKEIPEGERQPRQRRVVLLRRAPPDAPLADAVPAEWRPGPRLDSRGNVVAHSLLGRPEEFYRTGLRMGHLRLEDVPAAYRPEPTVDVPALRNAATEQLDDSTGSFKYQQWLPNSAYALPALDTDAAREYNREVLSRSGLSMRRLTEQMNQCGMASPMKHPTGSCTDYGARPASAVASSSTARSARLAGPQYSFIGGWSYQKEVLLG